MNNKSKASTFLEQWEWRTLEMRARGSRQYFTYWQASLQIPAYASYEGHHIPRNHSMWGLTQTPKGAWLRWYHCPLGLLGESPFPNYFKIISASKRKQSLRLSQNTFCVEPADWSLKLQRTDVRYLITRYRDSRNENVSHVSQKR